MGAPSRAGYLADSVAASEAEDTPKPCRLGPWADLVVVSAGAAVSEEASVAASREDAVAAEALEEALAAVEDSVAVATSTVVVTEVVLTDTALLGMLLQDPDAASEEATAAFPAVGMTVEAAAHMTTDQVAATAIVTEIATETAATVTEAAGQEATWNRSDPEEKVGIVVTEATETATETGTVTATGTETMTDPATTTTGNEATTAAAMRILESYVATDETRCVLRWVTTRASDLSVSFLLPFLHRG